MLRTPLSRWFVAWIGALVLLFAVPSAFAASGVGPVEDYAGAWQYRWGDSPRDASGRLAWSLLEGDEGWLPLAKLESPPGREGARFLWVRTRLVGRVEAEDPVLYLRGIDQIFEAYIDGALVCRFGSFEGENALRFSGFSPQYIPLGKGFEGKTLALRVYSDHVNIGPFGRPLIGSHAALALTMVRHDLPRLGMGLILIVSGLFVLLLFFSRRADRSNLAYGGFAASLGVYFCVATPARSLFIDAPLGWFYAELASLYVVPISVLAYLEHVFGRDRFRLLAVMRWAHTAYFVFAGAAIVLGLVSALQTLLPFQGMLLVTIVLMSVRAIVGALRGNLDDRIFGVGFVIAALACVHDVLKAVGIVSRSNASLSHAGLFVFTFAMGLVLVRRFAAVHERMTTSSARVEKQGALLAAAARLAKGDLETPIEVEEQGEFVDLARALDAMRKDVQAKVLMLEAKKAEVEVLNEELRRKIQQHTTTLLSTLTDNEPDEDDDLVGAETTFEVGSILAERYRVTRELGQGAMGVVYEVERLRDGRRLAAKVLTARSDKLAMTRFVREAQILARLDHPNLASIADVDVTPDGMLYLVMELCEGKPLHKCKERFKDARFCLSVLRQMADGLDAVHAQGVIHRDLKPANVMVAEGPSGEPRVKLVDFGISTLTALQEERTPSIHDSDRAPQSTRRPPQDSDRAPQSTRRPPQDSDRAPQSTRRPQPSQGEVTRTGILVGTPTYMAPELSGGSRHWKAHSDVFALGVIAYEILTGKRPFNVPPIFLGMQGQALPRPGALRQVKSLDPAVVAVLERALSADPEARPTAREIADTIRASIDEGFSGKTPLGS